MKTKIFKLSKDQKENEQIIDYCANIIKNGGIVAFPTETVYGLGANALDSDAVKKIFVAKGRPQDNPLIIHIAKNDDIYKLGCNISTTTTKLINHFWPGPLTVIVNRDNCVPDVVASGLNTIGIRLPIDKIARALINKSGVPIAAPSANLSTKPSPTMGKYVIEDLDGKVDAIIYYDNDKTFFGTESTVIDTTTIPFTILRPGSITLTDIELLIGSTNLSFADFNKTTIAPKSPGMKYKHYAPDANMTLVTGTNPALIVAKILELSSQNNEQIAILATDETKNLYKLKGLANVFSLGSRKALDQVVSNIYTTLRHCNHLKVKHIYAEGFVGNDLEITIMDRLKKAAAFNIEEV